MQNSKETSGNQFLGAIHFLFAFDSVNTWFPGFIANEGQKMIDGFLSHNYLSIVCIRPHLGEKKYLNSSWRQSDV